MTSMPDPALFTDRQFEALGVLVPLRLDPLRVLPGRHPMRRAGEGMRVLRTRPFVPGEDNPRDIDRFSPPDDRRVIEWEEEAAAAVDILVDNSPVMATAAKAALRNACTLQLLYSLWRAGDRVAVETFGGSLGRRAAGANLRGQMQHTIALLKHGPSAGYGAAPLALSPYLQGLGRRKCNLLFVVSDFDTGDAMPLPALPQWQRLREEFGRNLIPVAICSQLPRSAEGVVRVVDTARDRSTTLWLPRRRIQKANHAERERVAELVRHWRASGLDFVVLSRQKHVYAELSRLARSRRQRRH